MLLISFGFVYRHFNHFDKCSLRSFFRTILIVNKKKINFKKKAKPFFSPEWFLQVGYGHAAYLYVTCKARPRAIKKTSTHLLHHWLLLLKGVIHRVTIQTDMYTDSRGQSFFYSTHFFLVKTYMSRLSCSRDLEQLQRPRQLAYL